MNNYYRLYIESIFNLVETISIKFEDAAVALNLLVMEKYGIDSVTQDPYTWKYYQNISGMYHFSDTVMTVVSLDTLQTIEFNVANLTLHPATRKAYLFNERHYRELVQKYPEQESIILGMLYPCDITTAVTCKDGTILSYPSYLVDFNEYTFIEKLQYWIYKYITRWVNRQYTISDDLYTASYLGQLYLHLVPAIINIRLQACKTNEAHSFHVQQYLASHGMLDVYLDAMTKEQSLFFYRNILYIERNSGKRDTFDWLVDNIMTKRALPLYDYTMKHDISNMLPNDLNGNSVSYYPEVVFRKNPINFLAADSISTFSSLDQINTKITNVAPGNLEYQYFNKTDIRQQLEDSVSNVVGTKLLESSLIDYTDSTPYSLVDILLNHWLYWCTNNTYNASLSVTLLKNKKPIELGVKDAFILFIYALNKSVNITLDTIPEVVAYNVLQEPMVDIDVLRGCTETKYVSNSKIYDLYATVPFIDPANSIDAFYKQCKNIYDSTLQQYYIQCREENAIARGQLKLATCKLYADVKVQLAPPDSNYNIWLNMLGLDFTDYTNSDFNDFAISIVNEVTGLADNKAISIKQIQKSMVEMLVLLSSYSIQVISDISQPGVILIPTTSLRIGKTNNNDKSHEYVKGADANVKATIGKENTTNSFSFNKVYPLGTTKAKDISVVKISTGIQVASAPNVAKLNPVMVRTPNIKVNDVVDIVPY